MRYLVSVIDDTAGLATPEEQAAINVFDDRLKAEGHWVFAGGLAAPGSATVIDNRGEEAMFTDGPFLESKEYLAGLWIIEAAGPGVALKLAAEGSARERQREQREDDRARVEPESLQDRRHAGTLGVVDKGVLGAETDISLRSRRAATASRTPRRAGRRR